MNDPKKIQTSWNFEETVAQVETAIADIESGNLPLDTIFKKFEEAVQQVRECEDFLNCGQEKMDLLIEILDQPIEF
ncbi:MAG: exodeoxyribonuclease VII small subunit [Microcystaceae cyanobacterium]